MPDHDAAFGPLRLRINYAPLAYALVLACLAAGGQLSGGGLFLALVCMHAAWTYLRYFRANDLNGVRGDASDAFAFATLFPDPVRPLVAVAGSVIHLVCRPLIGVLLAAGGEAPAAGAGAKADLVSSIAQERTSAQDAERRRQRAMKALDERLAGSQSDSAA